MSHRERRFFWTPFRVVRAPIRCVQGPQLGHAHDRCPPGNRRNAEKIGVVLGVESTYEGREEEHLARLVKGFLLIGVGGENSTVWGLGNHVAPAVTSDDRHAW